MSLVLPSLICRLLALANTGFTAGCLPEFERDCRILCPGMLPVARAVPTAPRAVASGAVRASRPCHSPMSGARSRRDLPASTSRFRISASPMRLQPETFLGNGSGGVKIARGTAVEGGASHASDTERAISTRSPAHPPDVVDPGGPWLTGGGFGRIAGIRDRSARSRCGLHRQPPLSEHGHGLDPLRRHSVRRWHRRRSCRPLRRRRFLRCRSPRTWPSVSFGGGLPVLVGAAGAVGIRSRPRPGLTGFGLFPSVAHRHAARRRRGRALGIAQGMAM